MKVDTRGGKGWMRGKPIKREYMLVRGKAPMGAAAGNPVRGSGKWRTVVEDIRERVKGGLGYTASIMKDRLGVGEIIWAICEELL